MIATHANRLLILARTDETPVIQRPSSLPAVRAESWRAPPRLVERVPVEQVTWLDREAGPDGDRYSAITVLAVLAAEVFAARRVQGGGADPDRRRVTGQRPALARVTRHIDVVGKAGFGPGHPEIVVDEIHVRIIRAAFGLKLPQRAEPLRDQVIGDRPAVGILAHLALHPQRGEFLGHPAGAALARLALAVLVERLGDLLKL